MTPERSVEELAREAQCPICNGGGCKRSVRAGLRYALALAESMEGRQDMVELISKLKFVLREGK